MLQNTNLQNQFSCFSDRFRLQHTIHRSNIQETATKTGKTANAAAITWHLLELELDMAKM